MQLLKNQLDGIATQFINNQQREPFEKTVEYECKSEIVVLIATGYAVPKSPSVFCGVSFENSG
jgi:hypothetical protein